ncbi:hypothetical protein GO491_11930 [Flavobacteriaceae bacterium Ap0902]|nr:hypothetical protein [Flavobacteriaceae bacterium Ap0902]
MTNLSNYLRIEKSGNEFEFTYPNDRYLLVTANVSENEIQAVGGEFDEIWNEIQVSDIEIESIEILHENGTSKLNLLDKDKNQLIDAIADLVESGRKSVEFKQTA